MSGRRPQPPAGPEDGVTRRQFLVGGGVLAAGVAAAGIVGWRSWRVRDTWYRWTGAYGEPGTPPPPYRVTYRYGTIDSPHVALPAVYGIAYPPGYSAASATADHALTSVLVCLPGRGRSPRELLQGHLRFGDFVADGVEKRGVTPFVVAALEAGETYWHRRASGDDAMAVLHDEFIPMLRREFGAHAPLALMGWSMGGYGVLRAAELRPAAFRGVCAVSPALWRSYGAGVGDAFDSAADYAANDVFAGVDRLRHLPVRVDCGEQDPFYGAARAFAEALPKPPQGGFTPGGHNDAYWSRVAPAEVDFIGGVLARPGTS